VQQDLFDHNQAWALKLARRYSGESNDCSPEAEQAALIALFDCSKRFDIARGVSFRCFAYPRIRGSVLNAISAPHNSPPNVDLQLIPDHRAVREQDHNFISERVRAALTVLPDRERVAIELRFIRGFSILKVGKRLGVGPRQASCIIQRGLRLARERKSAWI